MTHVFKDLPVGTGAALGSFIRSIYLTASSRYAILGIGVNNLNITDRIADTTVLVSDIVIGLIGDDYSIVPEAISDRTQVGDTNIHRLVLTFENITELSTADFAPLLYTSERHIASFSSAVSVQVVIFVAEVQGSLREGMTSARLHEAGISDKFIPVATHGHHISKCWTTLDQHQFSEDVTIHFEGPTAEIEQYDFEHLCKKLQEYITILDAFSKRQTF